MLFFFIANIRITQECLFKVSVPELIFIKILTPKTVSGCQHMRKILPAIAGFEDERKPKSSHAGNL